MSRLKLFFSLTAAGLVALVVAVGFDSATRTHAQEPQAKSTRLKELLEERVSVTRKLADQTTLRIRTGEGSIEDLLEPTRLALEAALEASDSDKDRVKILEKSLATAKDNERLASQFYKAGKGRESVALAATAERLRIEIALERAKTGKGAKPQENKKKTDKNAQEKTDLVFNGSIEPFESIPIFSRVQGILKSQKVELGDRVQRGQILAVLDAPETQAKVDGDAVALDQARARVNQTKARVRIAMADLDAAKAAVVHAEAAAKAAAAMVKFREQQRLRMQDLFAQKAIEELILDESRQRYDAAVEADRAAKSAIVAAKSQVLAGAGKIEQAEADVVASEADVKLAQLKLDGSRQRASLTTITAPIDGVISQRNHSAGELIRAVDKEPIVTIQRVDLLRVVVSVSEREVSFIKTGNAVDIEINALPGKKWAAKVSRLSGALDPNTRTMRVEIDLGNPEGQIRPGMYARVFIGQNK